MQGSTNCCARVVFTCALQPETVQKQCCIGKVDVERQCTKELVHAPDVLVLHLKRFKSKLCSNGVVRCVVPCGYL